MHLNAHSNAVMKYLKLYIHLCLNAYLKHTYLNECDIFIYQWFNEINVNKKHIL